MKTLINSLFILFAIGLMSSCQKDDDFTPNNNDDTNPDAGLEYGLGALPNEDNDEIPTGIYFGNGDLPSQYDISEYLPPIGDQGSYGTCVAWALGYNLKTMIEAQDNNLNSEDLVDSRNQFSPTDLFLSIPNSDKAPNCSGTYLFSALDVMQNRGIAKMNTAPYSNLGDCTQGTLNEWDNEAKNFQIDNYRSVNIDVISIKQQIANDKPVGFGARLGDNFMNWDSDQVLSGHTTFDRVGQHAGHCMTVIGYDDNKGINGAFRVINSWGEFWGDRGFIWIDYNFFVSEDFASVAYTATNKKSNVDPSDPVDPNSFGDIDMIPWGLTDDQDGSNDPRSRTLSYNVYNIGSETAKASSDWAVTYLYYNAFDANEYGFLLYDYYSNDFGSFGDNAEMNSGPGLSGNWWNHVDVPGRSSITQAVSGTDENFNWGYEVPNITGYYYLVMIADVYDVLNDKDTDNNYYYMTDDYGYPIYFENGIAQFSSEPGMEEKSMSDINTIDKHKSPNQKNENLKNAYSKEEIQEMLIELKKKGKLQEGLSKFKKRTK